MLGSIVRRGFGVGIFLCSMNTLLMQLIIVVGREGQLLLKVNNGLCIASTISARNCLRDQSYCHPARHERRGCTE